MIQRAVAIEFSVVYFFEVVALRPSATGNSVLLLKSVTNP